MRSATKSIQIQHKQQNQMNINKIQSKSGLLELGNYIAPLLAACRLVISLLLEYAVLAFCCAGWVQDADRERLRRCPQRGFEGQHV